MSSRVLASLFLLLPLVAGCSSETATASNSGNTGGQVNGGQTGSLIPSCGIAPLSRAGESVPSGEQAFVIDTRDCGPAFSLTQIALSDAAGRPIEIELQPLGDGVYLVRSETLLDEGEYQVSLPAGAPAANEQIEVGQSEPLPESVGTLEVRASECEQTEIALLPDAALLPYLPLTQFSLAVDGGGSNVWSPYGSLSIVEGEAALVLNHCADGSCLSAGEHQLTVTAQIAGETLQPNAVSIAFDVACANTLAANDEAASDAGSGSCAFKRAPITASPWGLLIAFSLWISQRRRLAKAELGKRGQS